ncbi:hypothetical protein BOV91_11880, partial [Solemya velum gill symbiont]
IYGRDQVHHDDSKQFVDWVVGRVLYVAEDKTKVKRQRQDDKEAENDFFRIHRVLPFILLWIILVIIALDHTWLQSTFAAP